jgi:hypothetical protein
MKRFLSSLKMLTIATLLVGATVIPIAAQQEEIIEGCDNWTITTSSSGKKTYCSISSADDEWCYYDCLTVG